MLRCPDPSLVELKDTIVFIGLGSAMPWPSAPPSILQIVFSLVWLDHHHHGPALSHISRALLNPSLCFTVATNDAFSSYFCTFPYFWILLSSTKLLCSLGKLKSGGDILLSPLSVSSISQTCAFMDSNHSSLSGLAKPH